MKYIVNSHIAKLMDYDVNEFETLEEAVKFANDDFNYLNDYDLKRLDEYYILESFYPDEDHESHYDGDVVYDYLQLYKEGKDTRIKVN